MTRGPLVEIGSLETWTRISWPRFSTSWIGGALARRPLPLPPAPFFFATGSSGSSSSSSSSSSSGFIGGLPDEIGRVEKGAFLGADVDEGGLDAGEHCVDPAEVNVTDHAAGVGTIDQKLNELVVLEDRDPRFARGRVDQDFSFHRCPPHYSARRLGERSCGRSNKVRAVVLQGRVYDLLGTSPSALPIHVFGTRESRECPMHAEPQSVGTIYRRSACFRNSDNDLRAPIEVPARSGGQAHM